MRYIFVITLLLLSITINAQNIQELKEKTETCCQHLDEEYGDTWTILYSTTNLIDAQRLIDRYRMFDIANDYFESGGDYYIELVDPSDTLEYLSKYNFKLFNDYHKEKLIYIEFLVSDDNEPILNENGDNIMFRYE